jgi:hypothetical protein
MKTPAAAMLLLLPVGIAAQDSLPPKTLSAIKRAAVYIQIGHHGRLVSSGSGFVVHAAADHAIIATNHHVIKRLYEAGREVPPGLAPDSKPSKTPIKGAEMHVVLDSGTKDERLFKGEVLGSDSEVDLAVVRIKGRGFPQPIDIANAPELIETMPVFSFGFPLGHILSLDDKNNPAITVGRAVVSSLRTNGSGELTRIQIDGNLNPGNSGGPIVDAQGRLVGVAVSIIKDSNGIGFAVPSEEVRRMLAGRPGPCEVTQCISDTTKRVTAAFDVIDPMGKVKSAKIHYLPWNKWTRNKPPASPLSAVKGAKKTDATLAKGVASAKFTLDDPKEREVLLQSEVDNGGGKPVLSPVVKVTLEAARAVAEAKPDRVRDARPPADPKEALDRMKREMDRARKDADPRVGRNRFGGDGPPMVGFSFGNEFRDDAPKGAILVGVELGLAKQGSRSSVSAIRPIYRTAKGDVKGRAQGQNFGQFFVLRAKDGYAVGGASVSATLTVQGFGLRFMRIKDGELDPSDAYDSQWIGDRSDRASMVGGGTTPVVGIVGRHERDALKAFGLVLATEPVGGLAPPDKEPDENDKPRPKREAAKKKVKPTQPPEEMKPKKDRDEEPAPPKDGAYQDAAPAGGKLIGFEFGMRDTLSGDMIGAVRPIYRTPNGDKMGEALGEDFSRPVVVKAKDGFAVGGASVRVGSTLHGMSLTFMKVKADGLDAGDSYSSEFIGLNEGGKVLQLGGDGRPAVGVNGKTKGKFAGALGLKFAP